MLYIDVVILLSCGSRLALVYLLRCRPQDFFAIFAIKCSSFSKMNKGTSKRAECCSLGFAEHKSVKEANELLERHGTSHVQIKVRNTLE